MNFALEDLIKNTEKSVYMLSAAALAVPADKREWTPGGIARTTMDIMRECATFPGWIVTTVKNGAMPSEADSKQYREKIAAETPTMELVIELLKKNSADLVAFMKTFPEAKLNDQMTFPWGTYTILGTFGFHYWNNTYHLGQINYLQLILGDGEMHM